MSQSEKGDYTDRKLPYLELRVLGRESVTFSIKAVIDTGFDGTLLVWESYANGLGWPRTQEYRRLILADGSLSVGYSTVGYLKWLGQTIQQEVLVMRQIQTKYRDCLIGMGLLRGTQLLLGRASVEIKPE